MQIEVCRQKRDDIARKTTIRNKININSFGGVIVVFNYAKENGG